MFIKITAGTFGHNINGRVVAVRAGADPIEVDDAIGARLVSRGVAIKLEKPEGVEPTTGKAQNDDAEPENAGGFPAYNAEMTRAELEAIGLKVGLDAKELKEAKNKAAVIALIDGIKADSEADSEMPDFDPAAAIQ